MLPRPLTELVTGFALRAPWYVRERLKTLGVVVPNAERRTPEYLVKFVPSELQRWAVPIKASGNGWVTMVPA